ncbi:MAG: AI-2E family transporter [Bacteroidota bacterium]
MTKKKSWIIIAVLVLLFGFLAWYFSNIIIYIAVSTVLSIIGRPLVALFDKIKIGRFRFPHSLSALLTLLIIFAFIAGILTLLLPMLLNQASIISNIDSETFLNSFREPLEKLQQLLLKYQVITPDQDVETIVSDKLFSFVHNLSIPDIINTIIGLVGNIFVAFFAIAFITFFFLKQNNMLLSGIMLVTKVEMQSEVKHVYIKSIRLLSRYFIGMLLDLAIVMSLIALGMWGIGLKNALMIGILAGMMNIIPYVGPMIGAGIAIMLAVTGNIDADLNTVLAPMILKICGILVVINLTDAMLIQPTIYSKSVKTHPLEIFLVIMIAGSAAGITGMILAIPAYTFIRIILKEFFSSSRFVKKLTAKI